MVPANCDAEGEHLQQYLRYWRKRDEESQLRDDGFLLDPTSFLGKYSAPLPHTLDELADVPCIVLLGEQDMGKTVTLSELREKIDGLSGGLVTYVDLSYIWSEEKLVNSALRDDVYQNWVSSGDTMTILLDALDQSSPDPAKALHAVMQGLLSRELSKNVRKRLHIRIACRTADWPTSTEQELTDFWGLGNVEVLEACPLRRQDAIDSAKQQHLTSDEFMSWIDQKKVGPLAARPVTLSFLIDTFKANPGIEHVSQVQLYEKGVERLCEESNKRIRENSHVASVPNINKLSIAKRLAVTSILSGIRSFARRSADTPNDPHVLGFQKALATLRPGIERDGYTLDELLLSTYDCALFSAVGSEQLGWADPAYAEFLAAKYLTDRVLPEDIKALLSQDGLGTPIVRQLVPLTSWLCALSRPIYEWIREKSPELLLPIAPDFTESDEDKELLVEALLQSYSRPDRPYAPHRLARTAMRVRHPNLGRQLGHRLAERKQDSAARELALLYARELRLVELAPLCLEIALDCGESDELRVLAVGEVARSGNDEQYRGLRTLALCEADRPKSLEVLGTALDALWPSHLTPTELFASLVPPQDGMPFSTYMDFLNTTLPVSLSETNLPDGLEWVTSLDESWLSCRNSHRLIDAIMQASWRLASGHPNAFSLDAFARACWHLISARDSVVLTSQGRQNRGFFMSGDQTIRREVVAKILSFSDCTVDNARDLVRNHTPMLGSDDFEWIVAVLSRTVDGRGRAALVDLVWVLYWPDATAHASLLLDECERQPDLRSRFQESLQQVVFGSPEAKRMKTDYDLVRQDEEENAKAEAEQASTEKQHPTAASIQEVISEVLSNTPTDGVRPWLLIYDAVCETVDDSEWTSSIWPLDVKSMEAWKALDQKTQVDVLDSARNFLMSVDPRTEQWAGTNKWSRYASYGVPALVLLLRSADDPGTVSEQIVVRWLPAMVALPGFWPEDDKPVFATVLHELATLYPDTATEAARLMLASLLSAKNPSLDSLGHLDFVWNRSIAQLILETIGNVVIESGLLYWCLLALVNHGIEGVGESASQFIGRGATEDTEENPYMQALSASTVVMLYCRGWWSCLWPAVSANPSFGKDLVLRVTRRGFHGAESAVDNLADEDAGTFYIWLTEQFPEGRHGPYVGAHVVTDADNIYDLRNDLLTRLRKGESRGAVAALECIRARFPDDVLLSEYVSESAHNLASTMWTPIPCEDLWKVLDRPGARYVVTQDQLLDAVSDQIRNIQRRLHGETPMWRFLWNDVKVGRQHVWQPKEEGDISDWVKDCLTSSLAGTRIVLNREVQITRGVSSSTPGELEDIKVDATSHDEPHNPLEVVVETKGCWNPGLYKDMERQLAHRYLTTGNSRHGIYLVGWFNWEKWNDKTQYHRRARTCKVESKAELEKMLSAQANDLKRQGFSIVPIVLDFTPLGSLPMKSVRKEANRSAKSVKD